MFGAAVALFIGEGWEVEVEKVAGASSVLSEDVGAGGLEKLPAGPRMGGGVDDVADEAEPLDVNTGDIALGDGGVGAILSDDALVLKEGADDLSGGLTVIGGQSALEIALVGNETVGLSTTGSEALTAAVPGDLKTDAGAEIGEVDDELIERVGFVLQGGGDGEAFSVLEEAKDLAPPGGGALGIDETESAPTVDRRTRAGLDMRSCGIGGDACGLGAGHGALLGGKEVNAELILESADGNGAQIAAADDEFVTGGEDLEGGYGEIGLGEGRGCHFQDDLRPVIGAEFIRAEALNLAIELEQLSQGLGGTEGDGFAWQSLAENELESVLGAVGRVPI